MHVIIRLLLPLKHMRRRARKPSAKWLSVEAVTAERQRRRLERKRHRSEIDRQAYVLPNVMQINSLISHAEITYDPNLKPVLTLVSAGR